MYDSVITRFTADHPCWTAELLARAGEDAEALPGLEKQGLLERSGGVYTLTGAGRQAFAEAAAEMFLNEKPAEALADPQKSLLATELWLELERCNLQRWGIKRYLFRPRIETRPALDRGGLWTREGPRITWNYLASPFFKEMTESHGNVSISDRKPELRDPEAYKAWHSLPASRLPLDLLFLCDYDFENYLDFKGHPADELRLINADRFAFSSASSTEEQLDTIGRYHLWLWELRRLSICGYLDADTQEQGSVNWLIFLSETQEEALASAERLKAFGDELIRPANPMEIWTLSLEALRNSPARREVIWDVLPPLGRNVCATLQG